MSFGCYNIGFKIRYIMSMESIYTKFNYLKIRENNTFRKISDIFRYGYIKLQDTFYTSDIKIIPHIGEFERNNPVKNTDLRYRYIAINSIIPTHKYKSLISKSLICNTGADI